MPFLGSTAHTGVIVSSAVLTHDRDYDVPAAGNTATEWFRTLDLPRLSFHVKAGAPTTYTLQYVTGTGPTKIIDYPTVFNTGTAYEIHLPARWVRVKFVAAGVQGLHFHASGTS